MLFLPADCILRATPAFTLLQESRALFVTQAAVACHAGYAVSQIKKARGCNKRVWNPWPEEPPSPEAYCRLICDALRQPVPLEKAGLDLSHCIISKLPADCPPTWFAMYYSPVAGSGPFRGGEPACSSPTANDTRKGILLFDENAFECAKRQHRQYWEWKRNRNNARWSQQERGELDYDAKNMMHLIRLLYSAGNIVEKGEPLVRFTGEKLATLQAIRRGEWSFEQLIALANSLQAAINNKCNRLPESCDSHAIDLLMEAVMKKAGGKQ